MGGVLGCCCFCFCFLFYKLASGLIALASESMSNRTVLNNTFPKPGNMFHRSLRQAAQLPWEDLRGWIAASRPKARRPGARRRAAGGMPDGSPARRALGKKLQVGVRRLSRNSELQKAALAIADRRPPAPADVAVGKISASGLLLQ